MGFLIFGRKKKSEPTKAGKKRGRPTKEESAADAKRRRDQAIADGELELKLIEIEHRKRKALKDGDPEDDPIAYLVETREKLRKAGFSDERDDPEKLMRGLAAIAPAAPAIGEGLAKVLGALRGLAPAEGAVPPSTASAGAPATATPTTAESAETVAAAEGTKELRATADTPKIASKLSRIMIAAFAGSTPEEAAQTIQQTALSDPETWEPFAKDLCETSDEGRPGLFELMVRRYPDYAAFAAWATKQPEWLQATVNCLRLLRASTTPAA